MNDSPNSLSSNYGIDDSSPSVRTEISSGSNPSHSIIDQSAHEVIYVTDDSTSEKLSRGSLDKVASSSDSSLKALFFDKDEKDDHTMTHELVSSQVIGILTSSALLTIEMEVSILKRGMPNMIMLGIF